MAPPIPINPKSKPATPINDVLAANLIYFMEKEGLSQAALGKKADIAQTTISLYLTPSRRKAGASGKPPSAKLSEVERLAAALQVQVWELLIDVTPAERALFHGIEKLIQQSRASTTLVEDNGEKQPRKRDVA